jgi:hypothetical protein
VGGEAVDEINDGQGAFVGVAEVQGCGPVLRLRRWGLRGGHFGGGG